MSKHQTIDWEEYGWQTNIKMVDKKPDLHTVFHGYGWRQRLDWCGRRRVGNGVDHAHAQPSLSQDLVEGPRLNVIQDTIDEGDFQYGTMIRTTFHLKNVGDQTLKILGEPQVELVEGC